MILVCFTSPKLGKRQLSSRQTARYSALRRRYHREQGVTECDGGGSKMVSLFIEMVALFVVFLFFLKVSNCIN